MNTRLTGLVILLILASLLATPAQAELTLGFVPATGAPLRTHSQVENFGRYLATHLKTTVTHKSFAEDAKLRLWLTRYREIDIALVSRDFYQQHQDGSYVHLADYLPNAASPAVSIDTLIARRGLPEQDLQALKDILLVMDTDTAGSQLLAGLTIEQFPSPRTLLRPEAKPPSPIGKLPAPALREADTPSVKKPAEMAVRSVAEPLPEPLKSATGHQPIIASAGQRQPAMPDEPPASRQHPEPLSATLQQPPSLTASLPVATSEKLPDLTSDSAPDEATKPSFSLTPAGISAPESLTNQPPVKVQTPKPAIALPIWPFVVLILLGGLAIKYRLLRCRPRKQPLVTPSSALIQHDRAELDQLAFDRDQAISSPTQPAGLRMKAPATGLISIQEKLKPLPLMKNSDFPPNDKQQGPGPAAPGSEVVNLNLGGILTPAQVPSMLQFIAASGREGKLLVRSKFDEKTVSFSQGNIVGATSVNLANQHQSNFLMNKLGYLLVRQGKISETDRDRALILCENNSSLRLGEALVQLELLDAKTLQASLREQAKMILYSMIVFPEGVFKFVPQKLSLAKRDDLAINVRAFLREASEHQHEWRHIRQVIPSLDSVLRFSPDGKEKIVNGRLTVHQKYVLSLIDGRRPIREICQEATMLDYELYQFLFLMTKARILEHATDKSAATG